MNVVGFAQVFRLFTDNLLINRAGNLKAALSADTACGCLRKTRPCLRNVGTGQLADVETFNRFVQLFFQKLFVVFLQINDSRVTDDVQIGFGSAQKDRLFVIRQIVLFGAHVAVCGFYRIVGGQAVKQRLSDFCPDRRRPAAVIGIVAVVVVADVGIAAGQINGRTETGFGDRHVFVNRTQVGPLSLQIRVAAIGLAQSFENRFRPSRSAQQNAAHQN